MSDHVDFDDLPHQVQIDRLRENYERGNGSCRFTDDTESMFVSEDCGGDLNIVIYGPTDGQMGFVSLGPEEVIRLLDVLHYRVESCRMADEVARMSGLSDERLALIRARTERRWTEQQEDRRHHIDPTAADVAVALSDVDVLLEHVDHLTAKDARLREGIEAISSVSWDAVHPSWVKHMCQALLNPPTEGADHE